MHVLAITGLIVLDFEYFLYGTVIFFFMMHLYALVFHDWISHEYIQPRTWLLKGILLLFFYTQDNTIKSKKNYHVYHHRFWRDRALDPTYQKLKNLSLVRYVFSLHSPVQQSIPNTESSVLESSVLIKTLDKYSKHIYFAYLLLMFAVCSTGWFFAVAVYFPWLMLILFNVHDYYFHGPVNGKDASWTTFVFSTQAWHRRHHEFWFEEYYGPGWWRLLNPAWYYRHLFFVKI